MYLTLGMLVTIIAFLASVTVYFQEGSEKYLRLFAPFLLITIVIEEIASWLITIGKENAGLYNVFNIFNFCFYFYILYQVIRKPMIKRMIVLVLIFFPILSIWNVLFVQKIDVFNSMTFSVGSLLLVAMCVYYYIELFRLPNAVNLLKEPPFWICSGLLFFFVCSFPFLGLVNFISSASIAMIVRFTNYMTVINIVLYSLFATAFLCRIRIRKYT